MNRYVPWIVINNERNLSSCQTIKILCNFKNNVITTNVFDMTMSHSQMLTPENNPIGKTYTTFTKTKKYAIPFWQSSKTKHLIFWSRGRVSSWFTEKTKHQNTHQMHNVPIKVFIILDQHFFHPLTKKFLFTKCLQFLL